MTMKGSMCGIPVDPEKTRFKIEAMGRVYVIYNEKEMAIIYAGRTKNLRRRLFGDHKRGNIKGSQFRSALRKNYSLDSETQITRYILENCSFQFMVIEEFEEMVRLEHFTAAVLAPILNTKLKQ